MRNRIFSIILTVCILLWIVPTNVFVYATEGVDSSSTTTDDGSIWQYEVYDGGVCLTSYLGDAIDVYVPNTITVEETEYNVIKLGDSIFENNDTINSVTLGDAVLEIGNRAFYDCDQLVTIVTNEQMTTIGDEAFYSCDVFNSIVIYDAVTSIGTDAFALCPSLTIWCNEETAGYTYATENSIPYEVLNIYANARTVFQNGITYILTDGKAIAINYDESATEVTVPGTVEGYPVELFGTFKGCQTITAITLNEGITTIGNSAFYNCSKLTSITIPNSVTSIGDNAFRSCLKLTQIEIPGSISKIGDYAFYYCIALTKANILDGVTSIGYYAFGECKSLVDAVLPNSITRIGTYAFSSCTSLESIVIPDSITNIEDYVFNKCEKLNNIEIPSGVTDIGDYAFYYCKNLTSITIPNGVTSIGNGAFSWTNISSITLPESVTSIGKDVFGYCTKLVEINLPDTITDIDRSAFLNTGYYGDDSNWVNGVLYVGDYLISCNTSKSGSYAIKSGTRVVANSAFDGCSLLTSLNIPDSVVSIGSAFNQCKLLKSFTVDENNNNYSSVDGVLFDKNITILIEYPGNKADTTYTIPDSVTAIGNSSFTKCRNLTSLIISDSVTTIGENAFYDNDTLTRVTIGAGVKSISEGAFYDCDGLTSITIPDSVVTVCRNAFYGCYRLKNVTIGTGVTTMEEYAFSGCTELTKVYIKDISAWCNINFIGRDSNPLCNVGDLYLNGVIVSNLVIPDGVKSIVDSAFEWCTSLKSVTIPDSVKSIGKSAFHYCSNLESITVSDNVTHIGEYAFYETAYYNSSNNWEQGVLYIDNHIIATKYLDVSGVYKIRDNTKTVADYAFQSCFNIESIIIPSSLTHIGEGAFADCSGIADINIPDSVTSIGKKAFYYCSNLIDVTIPDSVIYIGDSAFGSCTKLSEIEIPNSVTRICDNTFYYCKNLTSVTIPDSITYIGDNAFKHCSALLNVEIPSSVTYIGNSAFSNCTKIASIDIPNSVKEIGSQAFYNTKIQKSIIPDNVTALQVNSFPNSTILMVFEKSYAHNFAVDNALHYFVLRRTNNPEIHYGEGISGTVSYTDGTVAANTNVEILYDDGVSKESVAADENGNYEFTYAEVGRYTIRATDNSGNTCSSVVYVKRMNAFDVYVSGDTNPTLKKGYSISGSVNEGGANITITDTQGNEIAETIADENGNFVFGNIPNGEYIVKAEGENGTVIGEVTVFDGNVSDIELNIETETPDESVTLWGYVEVEDREHAYHRRNWVEVKLYDIDGNVIAVTRSDKDGKYSFGNLSIGEYTIVATTTEMRPDKTYGYDRTHTLTGFAYVNAETAGEIQVETIVLYEENNHLATISGKLTAHGETQDCRVTLTNVFGDEISNLTTKKNGKYSFSNVCDGMYFITAITNSDGMGYTIVVVQDGEIFGDTDITVYKSDKVARQEMNFLTAVPHCATGEEAEPYRERIAEEKRLYDALSAKEKKQLSEVYVERLNVLCELLTQCAVITQEGVTVEQSGLVVSGNELETKDNISFNITVETTDAWDTNNDGVKNGKDFVHNNIKDKAKNKTVTQYYEITMSKTVDGEEKEITSVYKDTDSNGKFRITIEIPEEYKGYKNYSLVHVHCGETVLLTDLDDDPNTITFEVDKFSTFVLTATDETLGEAVEDEQNFKFAGASLTLTDNISVNYKVKKTLVTDQGYSGLHVKFIFDGQEYIVRKYTEVDEYYVFTFDNIAPNRMNDTVYATLYGTKDGELCESAEVEYSVATYCYNMLSKYSSDDYAKFRTLLVDLLNFGAQSQIYTSRNAHNLANAALTSEQMAWGTSDTRKFNSVHNLTYKTIESPTVFWKSGGLYLNDSVAMRFTIQTASIKNLRAEVTVGDTTYVINSARFKAIGDNKYYIYFDGLSATQMSETVYLTIYAGETAVSNTISYSIESYAAAKYNADDTALSDLVVSMMKYGDAANSYRISQQQ